MKRKLTRWFIYLLLIFMGWSLGYLRLPYIKENKAFWVGVAACLIGIILLFTVLYMWNRNELFTQLLGKKRSVNDENASKTYRWLWAMVAGCMLLSAGLSSYLIHRQNKSLKKQTYTQNKRIQDQSEIIESIRKSNLEFLKTSLLDRIEIELANSPDRTLSELTIHRLQSAVKYSFTPYRTLQDDTLSDIALSPERGQLLESLWKLNIDSVAFAKIKLKVSFAQADLSKVNLSNADLSYIDLRGAMLREANLSGVNLQNSDLRKADFWGANLSGGNLSNSDLRRANLAWAEMNKVDMHESNLNSANLTSAQLIESDLRGAEIKWVQLSSALLNNSNLKDAILFDSKLIMANLTNCNLSNALLRKSDFSSAILTNIHVAEAEVEEDWFNRLKDFGIEGLQALTNNYEVVSIDTIGSKFHTRRLAN